MCKVLHFPQVYFYTLLLRFFLVHAQTEALFTAPDPPIEGCHWKLWLTPCSALEMISLSSTLGCYFDYCQETFTLVFSCWLPTGKSLLLHEENQICLHCGSCSIRPLHIPVPHLASVHYNWVCCLLNGLNDKLVFYFIFLIPDNSNYMKYWEFLLSNFFYTCNWYIYIYTYIYIYN